jgi:hypothetical protein
MAKEYLWQEVTKPQPFSPLQSEAAQYAVEIVKKLAISAYGRVHCNYRTLDLTEVRSFGHSVLGTIVRGGSPRRQNEGLHQVHE